MVPFLMLPALGLDPQYGWTFAEYKDGTDPLGEPSKYTTHYFAVPSCIKSVQGILSKQKKNVLGHYDSKAEENLSLP